MQITTFERGLITNVEGIAKPHETASYVRNNRTEEHGWLAPRPGMIKVSSEENLTDVFVHKSIVLIVQNGILKWGRLSDDGLGVAFSLPGSTYLRVLPAPGTVEESLQVLPVEATAPAAPPNLRVVREKRSVPAAPPNLRVTRE